MTIKRTIVAATAVLILFAGCGSSSKKADDTTTTAKPVKQAEPGSTAGGSSGSESVDIKGFAFAKKTLSVKTGGKVTWTNQDSADHTVTSDKSDPAKFDSGHLSKGKTFSFTFAKAGTYKYFCDIHNYMTATVTVS